MATLNTFILVNIYLLVIFGYCIGDLGIQTAEITLADNTDRQIRGTERIRRDCTTFGTVSQVLGPRYCKITEYRRKKKSKGGSWWRSTIYYYVKTSRQVTVCCDGYGGTNCLPICHGKAGLSTCNMYNEGYVKHVDGKITTCSGGVCVAPNTCIDCNTGFYADNSDGLCKACKAITDCDIPRCSDGSSSTCDRCDGEVVYNKPGSYAYTHHVAVSQCKRACSWRDDARCYPGSCGKDMLYETCTCAKGFGGTNCATFLASAHELLKPQITDHELDLRREGGGPLFLPHPQFLDKKIWTNVIDWSTVGVKAKSSFKTESTTPQPYIDTVKTKIGIDKIFVTAVLKRGNVQSTWLSSKTCSYNSPCSLIKPNQALPSTAWHNVLQGGYPEPFAHLDSIVFTVSTSNGGIVYYTNQEKKPPQMYSYNINGITVSKTFELGFDIQPPKHCFELATRCEEQPLVTPDFVNTQSFQVSWDGWSDQDSGLQKYEIDVYSLTLKNKNATNPELEQAKIEKTISNISASKNSSTIHITTPGSYFVELAAIDWAGNHKLTRRILLVDDESIVELQGKLPVVITAANETDFTWINKHADGIRVNWTNRFINRRHVENGWLNAVKTHDNIPRELDDVGNTSTRSLSKIHNIQGIVKFTLGYNISYGSVMNLPIVTKDYVAVSPEDFNAQSMVIHEDLVDGKQLTFMIRGYDVMNRFAEDNVTVQIDMSPPVIHNLWLTKGDIVNVSVHNLEALNKLTFEWEVCDVHSGLNTISWRIVDNYTNADIVHGNAHESPQGNTKTLDECNVHYGNYSRGANCYCTPFDGCFHLHYQVKPKISTTEDDGLHAGKETGAHESDYFIEVTATNKAFLSTVYTKKITIDTSPPHVGVVHDGLHTQPEVDFQQSFDIASHWSGFFDKESGVWFYMYGYGTSCLNTSYFDLESSSNQIMTKTYSTNGQFTAANTGKYYVTVAAYNHALDHSVPVCSDGVTIDTSEVDITEVVINGAVTRKGLMKDGSGRVWVIYRDRVIQQIKSPSQTCVGKATLISDVLLSTFPIKRLINGETSLILTSDVCENLNGVNSNLLSYVTYDSHLDISWNVTFGSSSVNDFEVGLATQSITTPDKMNFVSANQHQHIRIIYPDIWDGEEFYILLKAVTKAAVESTKVIGPFAVDTLKPDFSGTINIALENEQGSRFLVATWDLEAFEDHGDPSPLDYTVALGSTKYQHNILPFEKLSPGGSCSVSVSCTAINIDTLPWSLHGHQSYYVTIKATNTIGLYTLACSSAYIHDVELASSGVVFDIDVNSEFPLQDIEDIDFQTRTIESSVRWSGFHHPHLDITYYACIFTPDMSVYYRCERTTRANEHTFRDLELIPYTTYYQSVIAHTDVGNVTVTSDGITIVVEDDELQGIIVYDGKTCDIPLDESFADERYHHSEDKRLVCQDELEFQSSTNQLHAYWTVQEDIKGFTPDAYWAIEARAPVADHWTLYSDYQHIKTSYHVKTNTLFLQAGRRYRISIKLCATIYCFRPVKSNGVTVVPNPPVEGILDVTHNNVTNSVHVEVTRFNDPDIEDLSEARHVMDHYEWAFTDNSHHGKLLTKWQRANVNEDLDDKVTFDIALTREIVFTKCWKLSVRGYTKAGLSSVLSSEIKNCSDVQQVRSSVVIDAVGPALMSAGSVGIIHEGQPVALEENSVWTDVDRDYTPYHNIISAVWPILRYKTYSWAVLGLQGNDPSVFYKSDILNVHDPCAHPDAIKCGITDSEYMNAFFESGELAHGHRYIVCIHANATGNVFEKWTQELEDISVCSDGITVDLTPPIPQPVWIGSNFGDKYQTSTSDMSVNWKSFIDVEEEDSSVHASGIDNYMVALGSSHGGVDIVDFTDVGLTNHHTFHDLMLQNGHSYFATVRARDFTSQLSGSVSSAIKVDNSPPAVTRRQIKLDQRHITHTTSVSACWEGVFVDIESGISYYTWSVGTQPGYEDSMNYTHTVMECAESDSNSPLDLIEGHAYFVSVRAFNNAGLYTTAVSWAVIVDASPPEKGHVYDGPRTIEEQNQDVDYITSNSILEVHWTDFNEQHGILKEYYVSAGSCENCEDVLAIQPVGITNDIKLDMLHLSEGMTYYVTVTACNTVDMCASVTSDGVLVDSSPPIPGRVLDETEGVDIQYQASRIYIGAQWYGFSDPQSDISHYVWRVGTTTGGDDILTATDVHTSEEAFILDISLLSGKTLRVGVRIYTTVRAYNKAGMYSESTSNGFVVDETPPIFKSPLAHVRLGSMVPNSSILNTVLKVGWNVEDQQSFIDHQYLSISSHMGGDFNLSSTKVEGIVRDYTFTGLDLHDGSRYDITLVSCNGAKLCTQSGVRGILVDGSHPTPGMFAIDTDHASVLNREPDSWMTYTIVGNIRLAWLGFADEHSGITKYIINIGSTYMGNDLNKVPDTPAEVTHTESSIQHGEGYVQVEEIQAKSLGKYYDIYISIWADNGVGLSSPIIHAKFNLVYGGMMELVRRCDALTCYGHCVCSPHGKLCHSEDVCNDVTGDNPYSIIEVTNHINLTFPGDTTVLKYSAINTMLAAKWKNQGNTPLWYEWSVGLRNNVLPVGVFDQAKERVWHDAGQNTSRVISLPLSHRLVEKYEYSFFVRAWYDQNTYAVFKSPGVMIYSTPPKSITIQGRKVKETSAGDEKDKDFIHKNMLVDVDWKGKFLNTSDSLWKYHLYISTHPGGHDAHVCSIDIPTSITHFNITGLDFAENTWYYSVVQAYNYAGLHTTESSDGFMMDNSPPSIGIVFDGEGFHDIHALNSSKEIPSFWHGFTDPESGIRAYEVCITSQKGTSYCDIYPWTQVGIATQSRLHLNPHVTDGAVLYSTVRAVDAVGHASDIAQSNGVVIDASPPRRSSNVSYGSNIIYNPSFETSTQTRSLEELASLTICDREAPEGWLISAEACAVTVRSEKSVVVPDGKNFLIIKGKISQKINGTVNAGSRKYRLTFFTSHVPVEKTLLSSNEGFVEVNTDKHVFLLYNKPENMKNTRSELSWQKHAFYFDNSDHNLTITISTLGKTAQFAIDGVTLEQMNAKNNDEKGGTIGHVQAYTVFIHDWASIHANWNFIDEESMIIEYLWAIGTVEGGTQLQDFVSIGRRTFAYTYSLHLVHDTVVFVTVVAVNGAGLRTVSYSDPILIDLTIPEFQWIHDGPILGEDVDYQQDLEVSANWKVTDKESGIKSCEWAIGVQPRDTSVQEYTIVPADAQTVLSSLHNVELPDKMVFVSLKCTNNAGLTAYATTDGVMIVTSPPTGEDVLLQLVSVSKTQYPTHGVYHGDSSSVKFRWTGFRNDEGIDSYLVALKGDSTHMTELVEGTITGFTYVSFTNLQLMDGNYTVSVTAVNHLQMYSQRQTADFYVLTKAPQETGKAIQLSWDPSKAELDIAWGGVFSSEHPMYYEVTVSQTEGGDGDLLQWQETRDTTLALTLDTDKMTGTDVNIRVSVRGISHCGLFETVYAEMLIET